MEITKQSFLDWFDYLTTDEKVDVWNVYAIECLNGYNEVYHNDGSFFDEQFKSAEDAVRAVCYGDYHYTHKYVWFTSDGNVESSDYIPDMVDPEEMFDFFVENLKEFDFISLDGLYQDEEEEEKC